MQWQMQDVSLYIYPSNIAYQEFQRDKAIFLIFQAELASRMQTQNIREFVYEVQILFGLSVAELWLKFVIDSGVVPL